VRHKTAVKPRQTGLLRSVHAVPTEVDSRTRVQRVPIPYGKSKLQPAVTELPPCSLVSHCILSLSPRWLQSVICSLITFIMAATLPPVSSQLSFAEVGKHNHAEDCWLVVHSKVYDITSFVQLHPGGSSSKYMSFIAVIAGLTRSQSSSDMQERMPPRLTRVCMHLVSSIKVSPPSNVWAS